MTFTRKKRPLPESRHLLLETLSAEIIAIGSELLAPDRSDTNSLWLTEKLNSIGIEVKLKTIVGDDDARLEEAIKDAARRSKIVITTGGLGPTEDDVTRKVAARALGRRLSLNETILEELRQKFLSFGQQMPERNSRQAMVIEDAEVLPNPNGSAPGMFIEHEGVAIVLLPGPPREMRPMFENHVQPRLVGRAGSVRVVRRMLRVAGIGESAVDEKIAPIYTQYENPQTTILFNQSEIEIHLTARGRTEGEAVTLLDHLSVQLEERLGNAVFSFAGEKMEEGIRKRARTDFGLSVTGIAGPGGGSEEKPVGLVYLALADDAHTKHRKLMIPGDRQLIR